MDFSTFKPLLDWIIAHPNWAGFAVFLISLSESLAVVGLFIPGVAMMFGIGTLIALGALDLWVTLGAATLGAIVGDGISYWLGHHYKDRLRGMWPFRKYPTLMRRGEQFFERHGGKSVLFGRFVGPVRPVIPVVAGMLGMPPMRFLVVNVASAIIWAPAYTLPGVVFGASLSLASEVATRLAVLLVAVLLTLWLTVWLVRRVYRYLQPRAGAIIDRLLSWGGSHRYTEHLVASVLDPEHPEWRGLAAMAAIFMVIGVGIAATAQLLMGPTIDRIDMAVFNFMQGLRAPWTDGLMVIFSELGDATVSLATALAMMTWLAWRKSWLAVLHIASAVIFAMLLAFILHLGVSPPSGGGPIKATGGIILSTVIYGLLAVMVAAGLAPKQRWLPYAVAGVLVVAILLARLHLGLTWFSRGVAGHLVALLWVVVLGAAYRRHSTQTPPARGLAAVIVAALSISGAVYTATHYEQDLARHTPQYILQPTEMNAWWEREWHELPPYRVDLEGHPTQPLDVQWAGSLKALADELRQHGWQRPAKLRSGAILQWLRPSPPLTDLPVLPQVHDGHHDSLRLVYPLPEGQGLVLRLWRSDRILQHPETPLWLGTVTPLRASTSLRLITLPLTGVEFDEARHVLLRSLGKLEWKHVHRENIATPTWDGHVLLIRAPAAVSQGR